jgi:carbohydrate diacid regulator
MHDSESHFMQVAVEVSTKAAELLGASVWVTDTLGKVIAASDTATVGQQAVLTGGQAEAGIPLLVGELEGEITIGQPLDGGPIPAHLTRGIIELLISHALLDEAVPDKEELKDLFIHNVLNGTVGDEDELLRQARILGLDLGPPRAVILIDASRYLLEPVGAPQPEETSGLAKQRARHVISSVVGFFRLPDDTICGYICEGEIAVLKASDTKNLVQWADQNDLSGQPGSSWANLAALKRAGEALLARLQTDTTSQFSIGIGRFHRGLAGLARSYEDARAALSLGRRFQAEAGIHCLDSLGIAAFVGVSDEQTKVELARYLLGPLDAEPDLITTLEVFFSESCHSLRTAARLGIHRNTLGYRLDKIMLLTGMDPREFEHAVQIRLALLLRSLQEDAPG